MYYYLIIIIIVILDQVSKLLAIHYVKPLNTIPILENVFHLTYAQNTGAAFSILSNKISLLTFITTIFIIILLIYLYRISSKDKKFNLLTFSLSLIIGGALGNLVDRMRLGYVVDFFDFRLINFAIFNVADCFIVVGSILLVVLIIFEEKLNKVK
ncbi:signal peptidase II [Alkalibaculum sp. M08DMB]|uniref:Lipoprotein signal peptidase n=1 Tax=Alkalibaculum sporogenes TaxID=2655001 RepID=A0A6A7K6N2_9FIRM|nr:signal peptidase II [Alkalibaculum sporogenes]MPW25054.1 signal peptidase II [Alkalibaculum sporogenes]